MAFLIIGQTNALILRVFFFRFFIFYFLPETKKECSNRANEPQQKMIGQLIACYNEIKIYELQ